MKSIRVYDLPTRVFHWFFAGSFLAAFFIAKAFDDDSPQYPIHMILGLTLGFMVFLRLLWGWLGTEHARFSGFQLNPKDLIQYFSDLFKGKTRLYAGHNPASSWAALVMLLLGTGLATTGFLMASGRKESLEDLHEVLGNLFFLTVLAHIVGIVIHSIRHRDPIGLSMVTGRKNLPPEDHEEIPRSFNWVAWIFVINVVVFATALFAQFDRQSGRLNFFGRTLELAEARDGKMPTAGEKEGAASADENTSQDEVLKQLEAPLDEGGIPVNHDVEDVETQED